MRKPSLPRGARGRNVFIHKGRVCDAPLADLLQRHPPRANAVLAHVRQATQGAVALAKHPFGCARLIDRDLEVDLDRFNRRGDHIAVVATAPLTQHEPWQAMAPGELRVFGQGRLPTARTLPAPDAKTAPLRSPRSPHRAEVGWSAP